MELKKFDEFELNENKIVNFFKRLGNFFSIMCPECKEKDDKDVKMNRGQNFLKSDSMYWECPECGHKEGLPINEDYIKDEEMREQINKVKKWKQFNEGYVNSVNLEKHLQELIETKSKIDELTGDDEDNQKFYELRKTKDFNKLYNKWVSLIENIKNYYKMELQSEFVKNSEIGVRKLHKEILDYLKKDKTMEEYTGVICFDLTEFTRNLIKKT